MRIWACAAAVAGDRRRLGGGQRAPRRRALDAALPARGGRRGARRRMRRARRAGRSRSRWRRPAAARRRPTCSRSSARGEDRNANVDVVVNDGGSVSCNGKEHPLDADLLLRARQILRDLEPQAELHLELPPGPRSQLRYTARMEAGTVSFADTSRGNPKLVPRARRVHQGRHRGRLRARAVASAPWRSCSPRSRRATRERVRALVAEDPARASARDARRALGGADRALPPAGRGARRAARRRSRARRARRRGDRAARRAARAPRVRPGRARRPLARGLHAAAPRRLLRRRPGGAAAARGRDGRRRRPGEPGPRPAAALRRRRPRPRRRAGAARGRGRSRRPSSRAASRRCSPPPTTTTPRWPSCCCATAPTPRSRPTTAATRPRWPARASRSSWRGSSRRRSGPCRSSARGPARARRSPAA